MATQENITSISIPSSGDLSSDQFKLVIINSDGEVALAGLNEIAAGVLQGKPSVQGEAAEVAILGAPKVIAGATITAGDQITSTAVGLADKAVSTDVVVGTALENAVINDVFRILFHSAGALLA